MRDLKGFLVWGAAIGSIIMFTIVFLAVSYWYTLNVKSDTMEASKNIADMTYNAIYHGMEKGWKRNEIMEFIESQNELFMNTPYSIEIYRGEVIQKVYGEIEQPPMDREVFDVFNRRIKKVIEEDKKMRYLYPIKAKNECFACHGITKAGEVLGVIEIKADLSNLLRQGLKKILWIILTLFPLPLIGSYTIASFLSNRVKRSAGLLQQRISDVNKIGDLSKIEMENVDLTFDEFNKLRDSMVEIIKKLRNIAVDKDILEFEIKLLERFIITSEMVKDWKDHVKHILIEINRFMDVYCIFSLFVVNHEGHEIEVFWRNTPDDKSKALLEKLIKERIAIHPFFKDVYRVNVIHNIVLPLNSLPNLEEELIQLQTKMLILETPRIGGIIGIGLNADIYTEPTRGLVIEGVLTTLLNVVGSIKAIYKYTKDLEYYATRDPLTGLFNQRIFWELLGYETERAKRHKSKFAVIIIDIDNFKVINDIYGHIFGDRFLQEIGNIMRNIFRTEDIISRYGGDEFACILINSDTEGAFFIANRLSKAVKDFSLKAPDGANVKATISIGIAVFPDHAGTPRELFIVADNMVHNAKFTGKDKILIPCLEDIESIFKDIGEKNIMITSAIDEKRVIPYFQPIMNLKTKQIEGYEALMRIQLKDKIITASEFIESASDIGVISKMEHMLMERIFDKITKTGYNGLVFINISPKALIFSEYIPTMRNIVKDYNIEPKRVILEITERDTVKNINLLQKFIHELKSEGFKFAIDDFGSGFSSFQYVKLFPIDFVKLEGEFIRGMLIEGVVDKAIAESITTFCKGVNIKTVAEFVENEETLKAVEEMGVEYVQGYYIGRPSPELI